MQKCKVIAVANQKGGVGKTTTTEHLGIGLAKAGKKVLLIDLDPQANLTACLGWQNVDALDHTVSDVIESSIRKETVKFEDIILHHDEGVDLIPSNISLSEYEPRLAGVFMREKILANGIEAIKNDYDYVLIDCSPTLGILTINAIVAADEILIPVQPQYLPAIGMTQLVRTIEEVRTNMKPDLKYSGIVFTLVNMQTNIAKDTIESVKETFGKHIKVYESYIPIYIPIATKVSESAIHGKSIYDFSSDSKASKAYEELTKEFLKDHREKKKDMER